MNMNQMSIFDFIQKPINPGEWVEESVLGEELTFEEITHMVGQTIIISKHTMSHKWYKAVRIERIIVPDEGYRQIVYYDGHRQRGYISEMYMDKSIRWATYAWKVRDKSKQTKGERRWKG